MNRVGKLSHQCFLCPIRKDAPSVVLGSPSPQTLVRTVFFFLNCTFLPKKANKLPKKSERVQFASVCCILSCLHLKLIDFRYGFVFIAESVPGHYCETGLRSHYCIMNKTLPT